MGRLPEGVTRQNLGAVELTGGFTPRHTGRHTLAVSGTGELRLTVGGAVLFDDRCAPEGDDPFEAFINPAERRVTAQLTAGERVEVTLRFVPGGPDLGEGPGPRCTSRLGHRAPQADADAEIAEAVRAAAEADVAVVVVATTEEAESEGFDRGDLRLPGRQDELVRRVAAANPHTVVVVNSGSPVELPWREQVACRAAELVPRPGGRGGAGRRPARRPRAGRPAAHHLAGPPRRRPGHHRHPDATANSRTPRGCSSATAPGSGPRAAPAYPFGHGLGYTDWEYESLDTTPDSVRVRVRNTGDRPGREVVQIYLAPTADAAPDAPERPARWLAGFAVVEAGPGESAEAEIPLPDRARSRSGDDGGAEDGGWRRVKGVYLVEAAHSVDDRRLTAEVTVG